MTEMKVLNKLKNDSQHIDLLEKEFSKIESQLNEIKSLVVNKPEQTCASSHNVEINTSNTNQGTTTELGAWKNLNRIEIMKNNLGETPKISELEKSETFAAAIKDIVSHNTKDGRTILTCSSNDIASNILKEVNNILPNHKAQIKKTI